MKLLKYILSLFIALFTIISCDQIPENERLIKVEQIPFERTVILEDYTGQKCPNCPNAHVEIDTLLRIFGDKLIPVSIHAGNLSLAALRTETGSEYNTFFNVEAYPTGVINRKKTSEGKYNLLSDLATWQGAIRSIIWEKSGYELSISNSFNTTDSVLTISVKVNDIDETTSKNVSLQLWLTENNIVATQFLPDGSRDSKYVHQHVLRDAVNGTWGEKISFNDENTVTKTYKYSFKLKKWDVTNCDIVAFIYDSGSNEIIEATKKAALNN